MRAFGEEGQEGRSKDTHRRLSFSGFFARTKDPLQACVFYTLGSIVLLLSRWFRCS